MQPNTNVAKQNLEGGDWFSRADDGGIPCRQEDGSGVGMDTNPGGGVETEILFPCSDGRVQPILGSLGIKTLQLVVVYEEDRLTNRNGKVLLYYDIGVLQKRERKEHVRDL